MVKLDIVAGLLGAGKTTVINQLLDQWYKGKRVVVIENEYGKTGIDTALFASREIEVKEITSGCICCTLKVNLIGGIREMISTYHPEFIILEPTGMASLKALLSVCVYLSDVQLHMVLTVVNGKKFLSYQKVFGRFFQEQIENSLLIYVNRMEEISAAEQEMIIGSIKEWNSKCTILTTLPLEPELEVFQNLAKVISPDEHFPKMTGKFPREKRFQNNSWIT